MSLVSLIRDIGVTHRWYHCECPVFTINHCFWFTFKYSVSYIAQALTAVQWNQLSYHVGQKPVVLTCLLLYRPIWASKDLRGLDTEVCASYSDWKFFRLFSRVLCGVLDGNSSRGWPEIRLPSGVPPVLCTPFLRASLRRYGESNRTYFHLIWSMYTRIQTRTIDNGLVC